MSEQRDGSWIDKWGACKLCGGEIPHGHTESCDLWKVEKERDQLRAENSALKLELGTQTSIAAHLEHTLTTPNETVLRCLENLNRNGDVSPQLAAEALAAIKGEA